MKRGLCTKFALAGLGLSSFSSFCKKWTDQCEVCGCRIFDFSLMLMVFIKFYFISKVENPEVMSYKSKDYNKYLKYLALLFNVDNIVFSPADNQNNHS